MCSFNIISSFLFWHWNSVKARRVNFMYIFLTILFLYLVDHAIAGIIGIGFAIFSLWNVGMETSLQFVQGIFTSVQIRGLILCGPSYYASVGTIKVHIHVRRGTQEYSMKLNTEISRSSDNMHQLFMEFVF